jgi:hypothetical protein
LSWKARTRPSRWPSRRVWPSLRSAKPRARRHLAGRRRRGAAPGSPAAALRVVDGGPARMHLRRRRHRRLRVVLQVEDGAARAIQSTRAERREAHPHVGGAVVERGRSEFTCHV